MNIPYFGMSTFMFVLLAISGFLSYALILRDPNGGMKTQPREMMQAFAFFVILSELMASLVAYGTFTNQSQFPQISSYLGVQNVWSQAINLIGGEATGIGAGVINVVKMFFAGILFLPLEIYQVFAYVFAVVNWFFLLVDFPFKHVPFPLNNFFQIMFYAFIGIALIYSVNVWNSGVRNG